MNRKTSLLSQSKSATKDYLKELPPSFARVAFRVKTGMLDIRTNSKYKYRENLKCAFCCVLGKIFDHFFTCRFGTRVPKEIKHFRLQHFGQNFHCRFLKCLGSFLRDT